MNATQVAKLLGRSLTATETTNFDLYLDIATDNLEEMLCMSIKNESSQRELDTREGYSTVFTGVFTEVNEVTDENGNTISEDDYSVRQWSKRNGRWYNSIVFDPKLTGTISVDAQWGFNRCMPSDLQLLLARCFDQISKTNTSQGLIQSKQVEDFRLTYRTDVTQQEQFEQDNGMIIRKYSLCNIGEVQSGDTCWGWDRWDRYNNMELKRWY